MFLYVYVGTSGGTGGWSWVPSVDASPAWVAFMADLLGGEVVDLSR